MILLTLGLAIFIFIVIPACLSSLPVWLDHA